MPYFQRFPLGLSSSQPGTATGAATIWEPHQPVRQGKTRQPRQPGKSRDEETPATARGGPHGQAIPLCPSARPGRCWCRGCRGSPQPGREAAGQRQQVPRWDGALSTRYHRAAAPTDDAVFLLSAALKPSRRNCPPRPPPGSAHQPPR